MELVIKKRLVWTFSLLVFFFFLLAAHLGYIQIIRGDYYARQALARGTEQVALEDYPRGMILDNKLRTLTGSYSANRVVVFPRLIEDPGAVSAGLSHILGVSPGEINKMISSGPARLPYPLTPEQAAAIRDRGWSGVLVAPVRFRYGERPLAAHVVGHLGRVRDMAELRGLVERSGRDYRLSDWTGRQGLELYYEKELKGDNSAGAARLFVDAAGNALRGIPVEVKAAGQDPSRCDVVTTLDADIQSKVEEILDRRVEKGTVVVMDRSGDILAMASRPSYHPDPDKLINNLGREKDLFLNQSTSLFQPGSIFKVVVAIAALEEGLVSTQTRFYCGGHNDELISCWHPGHGEISFEQAFAESCNPVFARLGLALGPEKIIYYARRLGLDNQSIIGYPVPPDKRQNFELIGEQYNLINSSVGQGPVLVTPVQIAALMNTIAGNGIYRQPRLVSQVTGEGKAVKDFPYGEGKRVISEHVSATLRDLLGMVTASGVGREAYLPGAGSAGKTGSAQLGDGSGRVNAWFSGYIPQNNPRYIITVMVRDGESGGKTAAPVFKEIAEEILRMDHADYMVNKSMDI